MKNVIAVENLFKSYGSVQAVSGITFSVPKGQTVGLLGGNGAGKTTTIAMLLGLLLPTSGRIEILGQDMSDQRWKVLPRMNFSSPYVDLPHRLTIYENLSVYARLYGIRNIRKRVEDLAETLELTDLLKRPVGKLSSGQTTRVALAKSLLNDPDLLLLDEPTASLDPETADRIRTHLADWRNRTGATILLASHNMGEVERMCDHVLMMKKGKIVDRGSPGELIEKHGRKNMEEVFLTIARQNDATEPRP
ncbi:MAG TPA: ABC transporter [Rhodospirillaceae bacterium]|nr:MAG: ABC transporter [Alphaproteobacteria bacterium GWF2_58_20]HAU29742.1 ABC transporter [Rhodospirillaceae bacterium]